jgi:uncharacterized protein (DUF1015 family)
MSLVSPFVGLLFDGSIVGSHDLVTTPPYDVISDDERRHYLEASPYNVIRLVLGRGEAGEGGTADKYRQAASELRTWRERGALVPTERPSFYPYEMRFSLHGRRRAIRAWSARWSSRTWAARSCRTSGRCPGRSRTASA